MKSISYLTIFSAAILPCLAQGGTVTVTYDTLYDDPTWPLSNTACSNGVNGLESQWPTLGDVPTYPAVGGIPGLTWDSTLCGTLWQLTYTAADGTTNTTTITAVDSGYDFDISETAFSAWAGSTGVAAGSVTATAVQVSPSPSQSQSSSSSSSPSSSPSSSSSSSSSPSPSPSTCGTS